MLKQEVNIDFPNCGDQNIFHFKDYEHGRHCHVWAVAAVVGGGAVVGSLVNSYTTSQAVDAQTAAQEKAIAEQRRQYEQTRADLAPYRDIGVNAGKDLQSRLPFLTSPIVMDQEALEKTPGYQFALKQGLKATQNSAAARGLGVSGAALKGAATFATGLADQTYQTQFNLENINRTNAYNRLKGLLDTGAGAAAGGAQVGINTANQISAAQTGIGNAEAAGYNKIGNNVAGGINSVTGYAAYKGLYGSGGNNSASSSGPAYDPGYNAT